MKSDTKIIYCCIAFFLFAVKVNAQVKNTADSLVITDLKSGLMWMRNDFSFLNNRFVLNWNECFDWQKKMNAAKYGGYADWYVPAIVEYRTINASKKDREIYKLRFNELDTLCVWGKGAYSFWARNEKSKYVASYISFLDGFATSGDKDKQVAGGEWEGIPFGFSVRLVRKIK